MPLSLFMDGAVPAGWKTLFALLIGLPQVLWELLLLLGLRAVYRYYNGKAIRIVVIYALLVGPWFVVLILALMPMAHFFLHDHYSTNK